MCCCVCGYWRTTFKNPVLSSAHKTCMMWLCEDHPHHKPVPSVYGWSWDGFIGVQCNSAFTNEQCHMFGLWLCQSDGKNTLFDWAPPSRSVDNLGDWTHNPGNILFLVRESDRICTEMPCELQIYIKWNRSSTEMTWNITKQLISLECDLFLLYCALVILKIFFLRSFQNFFLCVFLW